MAKKSNLRRRVYEYLWKKLGKDSDPYVREEVEKTTNRIMRMVAEDKRRLNGK